MDGFLKNCSWKHKWNLQNSPASNGNVLIIIRIFRPNACMHPFSSFIIKTNAERLTAGVQSWEYLLTGDESYPMELMLKFSCKERESSNVCANYLPERHTHTFTSQVQTCSDGFTLHKPILTSQVCKQGETCQLTMIQRVRRRTWSWRTEVRTSINTSEGISSN